MKNAVRLLIIALIFASSVKAQASSTLQQSLAAQEPENHAIVVGRLMQYHDSGEYGREIREIANAARDYVAARLKDEPKQDKLGAVFDIDETALSNWDAMSGCGFCSYSVEVKLFSDAQDPAIIPVLELFNFVKKNGVAVFFLTGRSSRERETTIRSLNAAGYNGWAELIMRPETDKSPARVFKSQERQRIEDKGYRIILNIGDQASDLAGCCSERVFKLPNPFYLVQ